MLLIDCGNSALKCRLIEAGAVKDSVFDLRDQQGRQGFLELLQKPALEQICVASVASAETTDRLLDDIRRLQPAAGLTRLATLPRLDGLKNAYHDHRQLGVDRWLTLVAAFFLFDRDVLIVDAGSAITLDLLSQRQGHLGGAILPGLNTPLDRFKALFPQLDYRDANIAMTDAPGRSTAECIHLLDRQQLLPHLQHLLLAWQQLLQPPVEILLCGQDAGAIAEALELDGQVVEDLVFQGMLKQLELEG